MGRYARARPAPPAGFSRGRRPAAFAVKGSAWQGAQSGSVGRAQRPSLGARRASVGPSSFLTTVPPVKRSFSLHQPLAALVDVFNRSEMGALRLQFIDRSDRPLYQEDDLWTYSGHTFVKDPRFAHAYRRAVQAGGFDYGIRWRVHTALWAAELGARAEGAFVECGTGRGFVASAICDYLDWGDRPFYLFDTFRPEFPDESGAQTGGMSPYYAESADTVARNFAEWDGAQLVIGRIPGTLVEQEQIEQVAFLHVDLNHAAGEEAVVRHFWPRLSAGAVMLYDDYGHQRFEALREVADRLSGELGFSVLALPTGQGLVVKP